jgi:hypothetical protein
MQKLLTPDDIANTARMLRAQHREAILILEGSTDLRLLRRFIDNTTSLIVFSHDKDKSINAIFLLDNENFEGAMAIIDKDFDEMDNISINSVNILFTDSHDFETMIVESPALEKVLIEYGSDKKLAKQWPNIRSSLLKAALPLGYVRWLSHSKYKIGLDFDKLNYSNFIEPKSYSCNISALITILISRSRGAKISAKAWETEISDLLHMAQYNPWHVCCGHDLVAILTYGLKKMFGNRRSKYIEADVIDSALRVGYELSYFVKSNLYLSIRNWEIKSGYKVLK